MSFATLNLKLQLLTSSSDYLRWPRWLPPWPWHLLLSRLSAATRAVKGFDAS